jgi:hypothetical protein
VLELTEQVAAALLIAVRQGVWLRCRLNRRAMRELNAWQRLKQIVHAIAVGSVKTIQISRGDMVTVEPREDFAKIHSATKKRILFLNLFATATKRNDLAVLPHSLIAARQR